MKKIKIIVASFVVSLGLAGMAYAPATYAAQCSTPKDCVNKGLNATGGTGTQTKPGDIVKLIVNALLYLIGAVSVIMIIIGGFRYVVSQGDSSNVTSAKNTILYAVIGLAVAIFAWAIVNFVVTQFA